MKFNSLTTATVSRWLPLIVLEVLNSFIHLVRVANKRKIIMRINLSIIILFMAFMQVSGESYAQNITLNEKDVSLESVFQSIKKQTGFFFIYNTQELADANVDIHVKNATIEETMKACLKNLPFTFKIIKNNVLVKRSEVRGAEEFSRSESIPALIVQQKEVHGTVTDEKGIPLVGVSVAVKGTSIGTVTDTDGYYTVSVSDEQITLVFSYIGFATKAASSKGNVINVTLLEDIASLNEVVVVGYTSKQLSSISSSISVVSAAELNTVTSNDVAKLLQGKAPGVVVSNSSGDPTTASNIVIRGSGSITASPAPLYVVDGIIGGSANPTDIESVTILKDAAATGLYGSRASNGVIIITTKTGKTGQTQINLNSTLGFSDVTTGNFKLMGSQELYDYQRSFYPADLFASLRPDSLLLHNTDWQELAFRTGITQNHSMSASGGTEKTHFYIAGNYYDEEGTLNLNGTKKYNIRTNLSHQINEKFKLSAKIDAGFQKNENEASGGYGALYGAYTNMPWDPAFNADGAVTSGNEPGWIGREYDNFLHGQQYNFNHERRSNIIGDLNLDYSILPNLTFATYNRVNLTNSKSELYYDVRTRPGVGLGLLYNGISYHSGIITSNRLTFDKKIGDHNVSAIAVGEAEKNYTDFNNLYGSSIPAGLRVMESAALIQRPQSNPGGILENAFSKGLVQVDYNFDHRYFAVVSFINESSSRFGASNRAANFYTLASSWILSNEDFMKKNTAFNLLKIRASYGITGNANIQDYQSLGLYSYSFQYGGNNAAVPFQLANNDLTWEKAKTFNLGLDIGLLNRLSVNLDLYDKTTQALLLNVQQPYTSGYSSVLQNIGAIRNKGLEINLNSLNFNRKDFKWETGFNMAFNRNKVLTLYENKDLTSGSQRISVGRDLYSWYMRKWAGVDPENGDPMWEIVSQETDGSKVVGTTNNYNLATMQFVGTASPDFTGGMSNTISYKNFSLDVFLNFVSGNQVYNSQRSAFDNDGASTEYNSMVLFDGWNRWVKSGDIATHPKPVVGGNKNAQQGSSRYMEDGSYVRLQNITLGYEIPSRILNKIKADYLKIYVSGDNLWTGTRFSGMDPEVPLSPGQGSIGVSNIKYPISRKVLFGINVRF